MKGEVAGKTHFPEAPGKQSKPIYFETDGIVVCKRIPVRLLRGDCVFQLGCAVKYGNSTFVTVGTSGNIFTSSDGSTLT